MKRNLSILIPMYGDDPRPMITELCRQAQAITELDYEVVVVDDGSPDSSLVQQCWEIAQWPHCRFMALETNIGRARIRNFLATLAQREWLLFLDCDMTIDNPLFLQHYLDSDGDVIYGGYKVGTGNRSCLRYQYEKSCEQQHTASQRRLRPYQHFHTSNFLVHKDIMAAHPFNSQFQNYGYEDVLFGKQLKQAGIPIHHIENPAGFFTFEDNTSYIRKTEEGLRTLHQFRKELNGYSQLLTFVNGIHIAAIRWLIRLWHFLFGRLERNNLCGTKPSLQLFKLYKIGYYFTLTKND